MKVNDGISQIELKNNHNRREYISYSSDALRTLYPNLDKLGQFLNSSNSTRVVSLEELSFNVNSFFHGPKECSCDIYHSDGSGFTYPEHLAAHVLGRKGFIKSGYRHGDPDLLECDIIDEENGVQIEVVVEMKNKNKTNGGRKCENAIFLGSNARNVDDISNALIEKFDCKKYNNKYKKGLCIWTFGDRESIALMANLVKCHIIRRYPLISKNYYELLYIIVYDIVLEEYHLFFVDMESLRLKEYTITDLPVFVVKSGKSVENIEPKKWYDTALQDEKGHTIRVVLRGDELTSMLNRRSLG